MNSLNTHPQIPTHEVVVVPLFGVEFTVDAELRRPPIPPEISKAPMARPYSIVYSVRYGGRWFYAESIFILDFIEELENELDKMPFNDSRGEK